MIFIQELTAYFHKTQLKLNLKLLIIIYHLTEQISFCVYGCKYSNYRQKPKKSVTTIIQPFGIVRNIVDSLILTIIDMLDKDFKHEDAEDCQKLISMVLSCFVTFANDEFFGDNPSEKFEPDLY